MGAQAQGMQPMQIQAPGQAMQPYGVQTELRLNAPLQPGVQPASPTSPYGVQQPMAGVVAGVPMPTVSPTMPAQRAEDWTRVEDPSSGKPYWYDSAGNTT